ncbi:hypothetical protein COY51_03910 [Candidatus Desantisbacteria bacterium CG_4_10_14_0_8_um_filter_39_17]|nr:MAG: hypothetical protein COY51_03910 [Candidatus Desantisbacteria bacterium CG_4_10_14_0_8_um_filter_39_17]
MKKQKGLTLVEVVISAAIFLVSIFGIIYLFPRGMHALARAREQTQVTNLGQEKIEEIRNIPYLNITAGDSFTTPPYKNNTLSDTVALESLYVGRTVTVESVDDPRDGTGAADVDGDVHDYKKIGIILQWNSRGENHEIQLSTIVTKR